MNLTQHQKSVINSTFAVAVRQNAVDDFYSIWFELSPTVQEKFAHTNMARQRQMFIEIIKLVVFSLDDVNQFINKLHQMGSRHVSYGVEKEDYPVLIHAFLLTLEQHLGDRYNDDVAEAWEIVFTTLADIMTDEF